MTTHLVVVSGTQLRVAWVLRHMESTNAQLLAEGREALTVEEAVWSYYLTLSTWKRGGRSAQIVSQRMNMTSADGRSKDVEVTYGLRARDRRNPEAQWTDCASFWAHYRQDEIDEAAAVVRGVLAAGAMTA